MAKETVCGNCGNRYTVEVTYCLNCGAVVGKSTAEVRELVNTYIPDRYIPSQLEKIKAVLDKMRFSPHDAIILPFYHKVTILKPRFPRFPRFSWKFPDLGKYFTTFLEPWRNEVVEAWNKHDHRICEGQTCKNPETHECGLPRKKAPVVNLKDAYHGPPPVGGGPFYIHDGDGNTKTINEARHDMGLASIDRGDQALSYSMDTGPDVVVISPAALLIGRLDNDYPFLSMDDHPCDDQWEQIGNHVVCGNCGRMMMRHLPPSIPAYTYGSSSIKKLVDQIVRKQSLVEKTKRYLTKGAIAPAIFKTGLALEFNDDMVDALGVAMHAAKAGEEVAVRPLTYIERYGSVLAVSRPEAAVQMRDLE